jgi:hypothetical protein
MTPGKARHSLESNVDLCTEQRPEHAFCAGRIINY